MISYEQLVKKNAAAIKTEVGKAETAQAKYFGKGVKMGGRMVRLEAGVMAYGQGIWATVAEAHAAE